MPQDKPMVKGVIPGETIEKIYTALGLYLAYGTVAFWFLTQSGSTSLAGGINVSFIGMNIPTAETPAAVAYLAIVFFATPLIAQLLVLNYWINNHAKCGCRFGRKAPTFWGMELGPKSFAADVIQFFTLALVVYIPFFGQIHFTRKLISQGAIYSIPYCDSLTLMNKSDHPTVGSAAYKLSEWFYPSNFLSPGRHQLDCASDFIIPTYFGMFVVGGFLLYLFATVNFQLIGMKSTFALAALILLVLLIA